MTALNSISSNDLCFLYGKSYIDKLFEAAELGEWNKVFQEIVKKPDLLNFRQPENGKTILWIAAKRLVNDMLIGASEDIESWSPVTSCWDALDFIKNVMDHGFKLDVDVYPDLEIGESVLGLLLFVLNNTFPWGKTFGEKLEEIICKILTQNKECNINLVRSNGWTVAMIALIATVKTNEVILTFPKISYSKRKDADYSTLDYLDWHLNNENRNIVKAHYLKIIENHGNDEDFSIKPLKASSFLSKFMDDSSFQEETKFLYYCILLGGELPPDYDDPEEIKKVNELRRELKKVFSKVKGQDYFYLNEISHKLIPNLLPTELKLHIMMDDIRVSLPELKDFPERLLKKCLLDNALFS